MKKNYNVLCGIVHVIFGIDPSPPHLIQEKKEAFHDSGPAVGGCSPV